MRLKDIITSYLAQQRSLGKVYRWEACTLAGFEKFTGDVPIHDIHPDVILDFMNRGRTTHETRSMKYRVLAGLFRFAVARDHLRASPMPKSPRVRVHSSFVPYIYSMAELKRLVAAVPAATADPYHTIDADTLRAFLLVLYGAGLRRGEAIRLKTKDLDLSQSLMHVRGTKFFKTRIVPMGDDLTAVMRTFISRPGEHYSAGSDSLLFSSRDGTPLNATTLGVTFRRLCSIAGIHRDGGSRMQPRMHDLRHSAAVHRVVEWYRRDADLNDLLPKLATYLGHAGLSGTQRYLTMTHELLTEASARFEAFAGDHHG
jgi:integrase/recombinase XerD